MRLRDGGHTNDYVPERIVPEPRGYRAVWAYPETKSFMSGPETRWVESVKGGRGAVRIFVPIEEGE